MPCYDYECWKCGNEWEVVEPSNRKKWRVCPRCGRELGRRVFKKVTTYNQDGQQYRDGADVVDPTESKEAAEFKNNPTRETRERYMKRHNLRFFEDGEKPERPKGPDIGKLAEKVVMKRQKDQSITVQPSGEK